MTQIKTLDSKTLKSWLDRKECLLIDVREPLEYKSSHIADAINISLSELGNKINNIPFLHDKKIVLHCAVGIRSMNGCLFLNKEGFKDKLWSLEGGIKFWINNGFPTIKSKN